MLSEPLRLILLLLPLAAACTSNESVRPDPGGAAAVTSGPPRVPVCPSGRGPKMVAVTLPGITPFCIDTTEVSQSQYVAFLDAKVDPAKQSRPRCVSMNPRFEPKVREDPGILWRDCPEGVWDPANRGAYPVTCVTHCDAIAYCEWAGKRLCGAIGGGPRPSDEDPAVVKNSEWYLACSQGGKHKYPYGDGFQAAKCDEGGKTGVPTPNPPALPRTTEASACHGVEAPFDQVFEMVGNAAEWDDHCPVDETLCTTRGGGALAVSENGIDCATSSESGSGAYAGVGIRCCADYK